ncbi:MAG TPA: hypothetical protein VIR55_06435 [Ignavibacteria bacterium]
MKNMKKVSFLFILLIFFIGCSVKPENIEKDKTFLKNPNLPFDRVLLAWNEPSEIRFLNTNKFIAVWDRNDGLGTTYQVRVLFYKYKVIGFSIQELDFDKIISKELSFSNN